MCIVIDANVLPCVFNKKNIYHKEFKPVYDWINGKGRGKVVYGGSTYLKELGKMGRYLNLLQELEKQDKVTVVNKKKIDSEEKKIKKKISKKCDDVHLIAILAVSKCKLLCSSDRRADKYITNPAFYDAGSKPKIYREKRHKHLLNIKNIVTICNK